ncbi:MAG: DHA2 family efflux MFS transporter permease subunit [Rhodospirillaceae bacterium]|nr:DHA2 family efflux MFS transporter permease subunit [Rhodospirillaceae bacterium]
MLATIMQVIDTTIANVALPHMQGSLGATQDQISWVLTSYIVAAAIMTPPTGWLADRFGRRRLFLVAVAGFTAASMLCGLAGSLDQMVAFRLLQGAFGAALVPLSQATLLDSYPRERHGSAMALWGVGIMIGPILGPTLGGYLTETYSWHWVFFINLPLGLLAMAGIRASVPEGRMERRGFDLFGFALLSLAVGALQMLLDRGEQQGWFQSTEIAVEAGLAVLALYMFLVHSFTARRPFVDLAMFRDRNFAVCTLFIFVVGIVLFSTLALLPPFLQTLMDYPVITVGLVLAPRGVGTMISMMVVGRLLGRVDARPIIVTGLLITAVSLWQMGGFTPEVAMGTIISTGFVQGIGLGLIFVPLSTLAFSTLPPARRPDATSLFSLSRNIGSSIGISVVISYLTRNAQIGHAVLAEQVSPYRQALADLPRAWDLTTVQGIAALNAEVTRQALAIAYVDDFRLMMVVVLLAIPLIAFIRRPAAAPPAAAAAME